MTRLSLRLRSHRRATHTYLVDRPYNGRIIHSSRYVIVVLDVDEARETTTLRDRVHAATVAQNMPSQYPVIGTRYSY